MTKSSRIRGNLNARGRSCRNDRAAGSEDPSGKEQCSCNPGPESGPGGRQHTCSTSLGASLTQVMVVPVLAQGGSLRPYPEAVLRLCRRIIDIARLRGIRFRGAQGRLCMPGQKNQPLVDRNS